MSHCIVNGNTAGRDMGVSGSSTKFTMANCVFSGNFPSDSFVTQIGANYATLATDSYKLFGINTEYCPANHLATRSDSPVASRTEPFAPTSPLVPPSSHNLDQTNAFPVTLSRPISCAFDPSLAFSVTSHFTPSFVLDGTSRPPSLPSGTLDFTKFSHRRRRAALVLRTSFYLWFGFFSNT
jgi:hypothetical protein